MIVTDQLIQFHNRFGFVSQSNFIYQNDPKDGALFCCDNLGTTDFVLVFLEAVIIPFFK